MERELIICSCWRPEHQLILAYDPDETELPRQVLFITIYLMPVNVGRRIIAAIQYIFGYQSRYGHFDEIMLEQPQINQLKAFIAKFEGASR